MKEIIESAPNTARPLYKSLKTYFDIDEGIGVGIKGWGEVRDTCPHLSTETYNKSIA